MLSGVYVHSVVIALAGGPGDVELGVHQRMVGQVRLQRRTCERGRTDEDDASGDRGDHQPLARGPVRHEDLFFLWRVLAFRALAATRLSRSARSTVGSGSVTVLAVRLALPTGVRAAGLGASGSSASAAPGCGCGNSGRLRRFRAPTKQAPPSTRCRGFGFGGFGDLRSGCSSDSCRLVGRGIVAVLTGRGKLLAQRHPMAATGSLGVGRFVGCCGVRRLSRQFSVRGQIT